LAIIGPFRQLGPAAFTPGFLGPLYAPLVVGENAGFFGGGGGADYEQLLKVKDLDLPASISRGQADARVGLLQGLEKEFAERRPGVTPRSHRAAYERAITMMRSAASKAFDLGEEKPAVRDAYGRNLFGQGCLLARRLVERGVPFIEVTLSSAPGVAAGLGWDTHSQNFEAVRGLSQVLDAAWSTLMEDLKQRGLLDTTLIVWMGEFGRTPQINGGQGRDHWATCWSTVLAGGGIKGGQVVGKTSAAGTEIVDRPVTVPDFLATICLALGIDPKTSNPSNVGRPIRITDPGSKPIQEVLA